MKAHSLISGRCLERTIDESYVMIFYWHMKNRAVCLTGTCSYPQQTSNGLGVCSPVLQTSWARGVCLMSMDNPAIFEVTSERFHQQCIPMDETWVQHLQPEIKEKLKHWRYTESLKVKPKRRGLRETRLPTFLACRGSAAGGPTGNGSWYYSNPTFLISWDSYRRESRRFQVGSDGLHQDTCSNYLIWHLQTAASSPRLKKGAQWLQFLRCDIMLLWTSVWDEICILHDTWTKVSSVHGSLHLSALWGVLNEELLYLSSAVFSLIRQKTLKNRSWEV